MKKTRRMDFYLFISNNDSTAYFPKNKPDYFTVNLTKNLCLRGNWEVCVKDFSAYLTFDTNTKPKWINLITNIGEASYIKGKRVQILRRIPVPSRVERYSESFIAPYYFAVTGAPFSVITVNILNENLEQSHLTGDISLTLHFKQV